MLEAAPKIDNIEILELIGQGGMSMVYRARQIQLQRIVAVKVLLSKSISGENGLKRFQSETRLSANLNHPNIVQTIGAGISENGEPYLVLEFIDGYSLAAEFEKNEGMSFGRFRDIFLPILSALEYAHDAGLVHRDIKPGNIMICKMQDGSETVKLVDFGIAKICAESAENEQRLTRTGAVIGSPMYMSPEQCQSKELDARADIYSISCVMYEALSGSTLFQGDSSLELMHRH